MSRSPASLLRQSLADPGLLVMPCCFDALSARLIQRAGFRLTFMSGFAVSAARLALPDTGLISYAEMLDQGRSICEAVSIPVIGDGDTGYGNPINVRRTVNGYARAGFAAVMIEDQVAPKRCGHTGGKQVVARREAVLRIRAAIDARCSGADILILARTDARATDGMEEALWRAAAFEDAGADIVFLEAPQSESELEQFCRAVKVPKLVNMLEGGKTPLLELDRLEAMGFKIAAFPLTLLNASIGAMQQALTSLKERRVPNPPLSFEAIKEVVGFNEYYDLERTYTDD